MNSLFDTFIYLLDDFEKKIHSVLETGDHNVSFSRTLLTFVCRAKFKTKVHMLNLKTCLDFNKKSSK